MGSQYDEDMAIFMAECEDLISLMERDLVRLENGELDRGLLQDLFRYAHTLKGSSATMGYEPMARVTHALEEVLGAVRDGELPVSEAVMDSLFESLDYLKHALEQIGAQKDLPDPGKVIEGLQALKKDDKKDRPTEFKRTMGGSGNSAQPTHEASGQNWQGTQYRIDLDLDPAGLMPSVRAFQVITVLGEVGRVVASDPDLPSIENGNIGHHLNVILSTEQPLEAIRDAIINIPEISGIEIVPVATQPAGKETESDQQPGRSKSGLDRTVRVGVEVLDNLMDLIGELVVNRTQLSQIASKLQDLDEGKGLDKELSMVSAHIGRISTQLQEGIMKARLVPLQMLFRKFPRMVRDIAHKSGKSIEFIIHGEDTELDRTVIESIDDPLIHILRNAVDHGIEPPEERQSKGKPETGKITLMAYHEENKVVIKVSDDGRGLDVENLKQSAVRKGIISEEVARNMTDQEAIDLIFIPGFSTARKVTDVSGRGVGMDVVRKNITAVNGTVEVNSHPGKGTTFTLRLPLTLAIVRALLVMSDDSIYAVPLSSVQEVINLGSIKIETIKGNFAINLRHKILPLFSLNYLLGRTTEQGTVARCPRAVVVKAGGHQIAIGVDELLGEQEVVIKNLGRFCGEVPGISGATILGDGGLALILDCGGLVSRSATARSSLLIRAS